MTPSDRKKETKKKKRHPQVETRSTSSNLFVSIITSFHVILLKIIANTQSFQWSQEFITQVLKSLGQFLSFLVEKV